MRAKTQIPFGNDNKKNKDAETAALRLIAIDWSGRVDAAGQRRHIWAGVWTRRVRGSDSGGVAGLSTASAKNADFGRDDTAVIEVRLEAGRTRDEVTEWLIEMARETPRMVVSIDCCFSFPGWFLKEHGCEDMFAFWRKANAGLAEQWLTPQRRSPPPGLARECDEVAHDERFWGKPHKRPEQFCGAGYRRMFRFADYDNKIAQALPGGDAGRAAKMKGIAPKSPFQIGGSGSVGTGSLRAMTMLERLHEAGFRVWPLESAALEAARPKPLLVEMYTRLMTGAVAKSNADARKRYLAARKKADAVYAPVGRAVMKKAQGSEDAFDALVSVMEMARHAEEFARLRATRDSELRGEGLTWRPGVRV
jgi:hypothetical protein